MKRMKKLGALTSAFLMSFALLVPGVSAEPVVPAVTQYTVPTPGSSLTGIATGPDGALWFVGYLLPYVGRLTTDGALTQFPLSQLDKRQDIIAGPDGALWFTSPLTHKIGRITTSGVITEYPVEGSPMDITVGPDGALWTAAQSHIERITTSGEVTEYTYESGGANYIAPGSDGALWFTSGNKIQRITTTGVLTEYPLESNAILQGMTQGPDGAVWFGVFYPASGSSAASSAIGRISTEGDIAQYPMPSSNRTPRSITPGPDGTLWFTMGPAGIGQITMSGEITLLTTQSISGPVGITAGFNNDLWVTAQTNKVVRFDLTGGRVLSASFDVNPKPVSQSSVTLTAQINDDGAVSIVEYYDPIQQTWVEMFTDGLTSTATVDTPAASYPAGMYPFLVRTQNPEGDISTPITVYLDVYNPAGGYAAGHGSITPSGTTSNPGDNLPAVAGNNLKATLDFTVKYDTPTSTAPTGSSVFSWGKSCNKPNNDCFVMTTDSVDWLIVPTTNTTATFQGHASLTLAGQSQGSNYPVRIAVSSGMTDHYLLRIYPVGSNPDITAPLYQASGDLTGGQIVLHQ